MKSFLNSLEHASKKKIYQEYEVKLGIDKIAIFIPAEAVQRFDEEMQKPKNVPTNRRQLQEIVVDKYKGIIS